jgi:hypothetical protein
VQTSVKLAANSRATVNGSEQIALVAGSVGSIQEVRDAGDVA